MTNDQNVSRETFWPKFSHCNQDNNKNIETKIVDNIKQRIENQLFMMTNRTNRRSSSIHESMLRMLCNPVAEKRFPAGMVARFV